VHLRISSQADADLDEIWTYVAKDSGSEQFATKLIGRLTQSFILLLRFPHLGRIRGSEKYPDIRTYAVGSLVIYYRAVNDVLQILRIVRGRRSDFITIPEE
jgi:plasmid stabilization system protein ParE